MRVRRSRAMAPGEWTSDGRPAVRAAMRWALVAPLASHCSAKASRASHSAAERTMRRSAVPSAARAA